MCTRITNKIVELELKHTKKPLQLPKKLLTSFNPPMVKPNWKFLRRTEIPKQLGCCVLIHYVCIHILLSHSSLLMALAGLDGSERKNQNLYRNSPVGCFVDAQHLAALFPMVAGSLVRAAGGASFSICSIFLYPLLLVVRVLSEAMYYLPYHPALFSALTLRLLLNSPC